MSTPEVNVHVLDAAYKPFPSFAEWVSRSSVDTVRWNRYKVALDDGAEHSSEAFQRAREVVKRAAALDTGAIEGLYEVDGGFTFTVAMETAAWEVELAKKGENVRPLFDAQLHAYDYVLDMATQTVPISEAAIRKLHEVVCGAQETYRVITSIGFQEQPLPKGRYKVLPNHVTHTREGITHSYAPVDVTPVEMARLVAAMRAEEFLAAHPVQQAAYAHYGLVVIHPFADGNGRVARALASVFTYRAISMPIMILSEHKEAYLDALVSADGGDFQPFVDFMLRRSVDTMTIVHDNLQKALVPTAEESLAAISGPAIAKGRFSNKQIDDGGTKFLNALKEDIQKELSRKVADPKIQSKVGLTVGSHPIYLPTHRASHGVGEHLDVELVAIQPSRVQNISLPPEVVTRRYDLLVPKDATGQDEYQILERDKKSEYAMPVDDILPVLSGTAQLRIGIFAERLVAEMLAELRAKVDRVNEKR